MGRGVGPGFGFSLLRNEAVFLEALANKKKLSASRKLGAHCAGESVQHSLRLLYGREGPHFLVEEDARYHITPGASVTTSNEMLTTGLNRTPVVAIKKNNHDPA